MGALPSQHPPDWWNINGPWIDVILTSSSAAAGVRVTRSGPRPHQGYDGPRDDLGERLSSQRSGEPSSGDDERNGGKREPQGEGAGMAEPVAVAEAQEAGGEQVPEATAPDGVPRIVRGELLAGHQLGLGNDADRAHAAASAAARFPDERHIRPNLCGERANRQCDSRWGT
jgi:hypothetical protein